MRTMIPRPSTMSKWAVLLVCALAVGCGDAAEPTGSGDAQVSADTASEGGDAESSGDLDATTLSDATDVAGDDAEALTDTEEFPSDLPIITEIQEDVDLSEYFPDSVGPDADAATEPVDDAVSDVILDDADQAMSDVSDEDAEVSADGSADGLDEPDTFLADCENLGVAPQWSGNFEGAIEYHIPEALEDLFYPTDGILIVGGTLSFDIECVDSKLIVSGDMAGTANVAGEGDFPFTITLAGYFNPETGLLNASLVDGMVVLYGLAEIYFSGDFIGTLSDEIFNGTWTGIYDGTNFPLPPGDVPDADGNGTWSAQAAEVD